MPKKRRSRLRLLAILAVVCVALGVAAHFSLPHVVSYLVRSSLDELSSEMGLDIRFERLELIKLNEYHLYRVEVEDQSTSMGGPFFTADRIGVTLDRARLFGGDVIIRGIELEKPGLVLSDDPTSQYGVARLRRRLDRVLARTGQAGVGEEGTGAGPEQRRRFDPFGGRVPTVSVSGGDVALLGVEDTHLPSGLGDVELAVSATSSGTRFDLQASLQGLGEGPFARPPTGFALGGLFNAEDDVAEVTLTFAQPLELAAVPGIPEVSMRIGALGYEHPNTVTVDNLEFVETATQSRVVWVPELEIALRQLTTSLADIQLDLVKAAGVRTYIEIDRQGRSNIARLLGMSGAGPLQSILPERVRRALDDEDSAEPPAPVPVPAPAVAERDEDAPPGWCENQRWWDCFPQTLEITDLAAEVLVHDSGQVLRTIDVELPSFIAGKRLINFQMDVSTSLQVSERGVGPIGAIDLDLIYFWLSGRWRVELDLENIDLGRALDISPYPNVLRIRSGVVDGEMMVSDHRPVDGELHIRPDLRVTDLSLQFDAIDAEPVEFADLRYVFRAAISQDQHLRMTRGTLEIGDMSTDIRVELSDLEPGVLVDYALGFTHEERPAEYWEARAGLPAPVSSARLWINMPPQRVMHVFDAIPNAFRRSLEGTRMQGEVAWELDITAEYTRAEDGRLSVDVPRPAVADVTDVGVELITLPEAVDVRRLLDNFDFTFTDGIGETRLLTVGEDNPRWVPLDLISPHLITAILTTEDQSFFESDGFNWFQMRKVVGQVLGEQQLGRGASTITMQLVRNVFLSRERLISRKLTEMFLAYWMTRQVPKERILSVYLNIIEFGPGINGVAEAAEHYFGKLPLDLTLGEAVFLVSIVPGPRRYYTFYEQGEITDRWWEYMQRYIDIMLRRETITEEEHAAATQARPLFYIRHQGDPPLRPIEPEPPFIPLFDDL